MLEIGRLNRLKIDRITPAGAYLSTEEGDILLPAWLVPKNAAAGEELDVFVHHDTEDQLTATTKVPKAMVGEFALLRVKDNVSVGTFLDWGLGKDLLLPFGEQTAPLRRGEKVLVHVYLHSSGRIAASAKLDKFLKPVDFSLAEGDEVDLLIYAFSDLGAKVIINDTFGGLLFRDELYINPACGDRMRGYIKKIREDGKIDVTLLKGGARDADADREIVLVGLKAHNGFLPLNDKSSPEDIADLLRMSKKSFKKAVGGLYKDRLIEMGVDGIRLRG
jgi:uncharacterized protein